MADYYYVQVTSQKSEGEALAAYKSLQSKFPNELGNRQPLIHRADLGYQGIFFRAMVGPFTSSQEAGALCSNIMAAGGQCLIQSDDRPPPDIARKVVADKPKAKTPQAQAETVQAKWKRCIVNRTPAIGMTKAEVYAMCGQPERINTTQTAHGTSEQLSYLGLLYIYLTDGIVTALQY